MPPWICIFFVFFLFFNCTFPYKKFWPKIFILSLPIWFIIKEITLDWNLSIIPNILTVGSGTPLLSLGLRQLNFVLERLRLRYKSPTWYDNPMTLPNIIVGCIQEECSIVCLFHLPVFVAVVKIEDVWNFPTFVWHFFVFIFSPMKNRNIWKHCLEF